MADGINRREVLMLSAAALAAGVAAAPVAGADEQGAAGVKRRPLMKAYFGLPKGGSTLIERFKILKDAGFDGLQLNMPASDLPVDKVQEALNESGLKLEGTCD
jgi:L-ribulose-5-phosphate 3-epimerase